MTSFDAFKHLLQRFLIGQPMFVPTSISDSEGKLAVPKSSSVSANGTTSSAWECRMTVSGFTVVAVPHRFQAGQSRTSGVDARVDVHGDGPTPAGADHNIGMMPVELGLGDPDGFVEIIVGQGRIQDLVAVVLEIGRLDAARCRLPAVEEEDGH